MNKIVMAVKGVKRDFESRLHNLYLMSHTFQLHKKSSLGLVKRMMNYEQRINSQHK